MSGWDRSEDCEYKDGSKQVHHNKTVKIMLSILFASVFSKTLDEPFIVMNFLEYGAKY